MLLNSDFFKFVIKREWTKTGFLVKLAIIRQMKLTQNDISEVCMGIEAHITELRDKHKTLDLKIQKERSHPNIDSIKITIHFLRQRR